MKALVLLFLFLSACSFPTRSPSPREYYLELQGQWKSSCFEFMGLYRTQTMTFSDRNLQVIEVVFEDALCQNAVTENVIESKFSMGVEMSMILERGHQIFMTPSVVVLKPLTPIVADDFNANATCGYTNWAFNEYKNVSGLACDSGDKSNPEVDKKYLNLIKIVDGVLTFGNDRCEIDDSCISYYGQKYPRYWYPFSLQKQ